MLRFPRYCERLYMTVCVWGIGTLILVTGGPGEAWAQEVEFGTHAAFDPPSYVAYRTENTLKIDGKATEAAWQRAEWTGPFIDIRGEKHPTPRFETRAKMLWDEEYFYVAAHLEEPDVWATLTDRDATIFRDNAFEVFIDPNGDTHNYYELEVNAFGTLWDLFLGKPAGNGRVSLSAWDVRGIEVGVHVNGTLNKPGDTDEGWTVEMALPWPVLEEAAPRDGPPGDGEQWRLNFARAQWPFKIANGAYHKEENARADWWTWASQGSVNMHKPERYGYVQFADEVVGRGTASFTDPPNERVKWALRRLYYRQNEYRERNGRYAPTLSELNAGEITVEDRDFRPTLQTTQSMYEITASGANGTIVHIRHDGKVWTTATQKSERLREVESGSE